MHKVWVIARREFIERVRTRWFLISTVLGPLFMAVVLILPVVVATSGGRERSIAVVDLTTGGFGERLTADLDRSQPIRAARVETSVADLESVADSLALLVRLKGLDGFLILSDEALDDGRAEYRGTNVSSPRDMQILTKYLEESALTERLTRAGVDPAAVRHARVDMRLQTTKITGRRGAAESGEGSFVLAYAMWFVLYIAIVVYGVSVMGSVVEEKTSRVIEVLVSSVRPFQLLAGKIVGVGSVGLFQLLIWG
ncbi:MAG: ABC transporter permease, partial [Gemmatimonadetes bacterium]|nr:ABC transporter permease [Gemmatimonadota bacterium]